jgi:hypothetical protein
MTWPVQTPPELDDDYPAVTTVIGERLHVVQITDTDLLGDEATPAERWLVERGRRVA